MIYRSTTTVVQKNSSALSLLPSMRMTTVLSLSSHDIMVTNMPTLVWASLADGSVFTFSIHLDGRRLFAQANFLRALMWLGVVNAASEERPR